MFGQKSVNKQKPVSYDELKELETAGDQGGRSRLSKETDKILDCKQEQELKLRETGETTNGLSRGGRRDKTKYTIYEQDSWLTVWTGENKGRLTST